MRVKIAYLNLNPIPYYRFWFRFQTLYIILTRCLIFTVRFHIAHLYEVQGKYKIAKDSYENLLNEKDLPIHLRADICRQLGMLLCRYQRYF